MRAYVRPVILLAWWFLLLGADSGDRDTIGGPFKSSDECERVRKEITTLVTPGKTPIRLVSPSCWEG